MSDLFRGHQYLNNQVGLRSRMFIFQPVTKCYVPLMSCLMIDKNKLNTEIKFGKFRIEWIHWLLMKILNCDMSMRKLVEKLRWPLIWWLLVEIEDSKICLHVRVWIILSFIFISPASLLLPRHRNIFAWGEILVRKWCYQY